MLEYFNFVGCFAYSLLLLPIIVSRDKSFRTPFWIFFISGGIYGIYCVLVFDNDWSWDGTSAVVRRATSTIAALAHTIAKLYVAISRYAVLRSKYLTENDWNRSTIVAMLAAQLIIPTLVCAPFAFAEPTGIGKAYGPNYLTDIVRAISATVYFVYVFVGLILTLLSMRRLRVLMAVASRSQQKRTVSLVRQEAVFTIYSSLLFLSHSLKCAQQIIFVVYASDPIVYRDSLALYPYINDIAVFSSPLLIIFTSSKLRRLICSYFRLRHMPLVSTLATNTI